MKTWVYTICIILVAALGVWLVRGATSVENPQIVEVQKIKETSVKAMEKHKGEADKISIEVVKVEKKIEPLMKKCNVSVTQESIYIPPSFDDVDAERELMLVLVQQNQLLKKENEELRFSLAEAKNALRDSELEITLRKAEIDARNAAIRNARVRGIGEGALGVVLTRAVFEMFKK